MKTPASQVEAFNEGEQVQAEQVEAIKALHELSAIELAYVGGGTASVSFI